MKILCLILAISLIELVLVNNLESSAALNFATNVYKSFEPRHGIQVLQPVAQASKNASRFSITKSCSANDPFHPPSFGDQVTAVPDCPDLVDWFQFRNRSINHAPTDEFMDPTDYATCFRQCTERLSCTSFTFDSASGFCKLFNVVNSENVAESPTVSITLKIYPVATMLNEWFVTRDVRPVGSFFVQENATNHIHCLSICGSTKLVKFCSAAIFNLDTKQCTLYNGYARKLIWRVEGRTVSIAHASMFLSSQFFRFQEMTNVFPKNASPTLTFTAINIQSCLDTCVAAANEGNCMLVATRAMSGSSSVDCQIFEYFQSHFEKDMSLSGSINSFYLNVPKTNTRHKILPPYLIINGEPLETIQGYSLEECHEVAEKRSNVYFYSFNSSSAICTLFMRAVSLELSENPDFERDLKSFSKSVPIFSPNFYAFESFWTSSIPYRNIDLLNDCHMDNFLDQCLADKNCFGVAINQIGGGYCASLNEVQMTHILSQQNKPPSTLQFQIFQKMDDLRFLEDQDRVKCVNSLLVDSSDLDDGSSFEELQNFRKKIPRDGKGPMAPHGVDFVSQTKKLKEPAVVMEMGGKESLNFIPSVGRGERANGRHGKAIFGQLGGPFQSSSVPVTGAVPNWSLKGRKDSHNFGGVGVIKCVSNHCNEKGCDTVCPIPNGTEDIGSHFLSRIFPAVTTTTVDDSCRCNVQPRTIPPGTRIFPQDQVYLEQQCKGHSIKDQCRMCCRVGYNVIRHPICTCDNNPSAYWNPNPSPCVPLGNCGIQDSQLRYPMRMWKVSIRNCVNMNYFGVNFLPEQKLPFFAIYKFTGQNANDRIGKEHPNLADWRPDWVSYPCVERGLHGLQMNQADYHAIGGFSKWHRGQLAPNVHFRFLRDAASATHQYINAAPQDAFSNGQWRILEMYIRDILGSTILSGETRQGYVITGICLPVWEVLIPDCFWKMVCTRTDNGEVVVGTFFHFNTESKDDASRNDRQNEIFQVRHQNYLRSPWIDLDPRDIWDDAKSLIDHPGFGYDSCKEASNVNFPPLRPTKKESEDELEISQGYPNEETFVRNNVLEKAATHQLLAQQPPPSIFENQSESPPSCLKKVVGFVTNWGAKPFTIVQANYLTHAIFAYVRMTSDGSLVVGGSAKNSVATNKTILRLHEMWFAKKQSENRLKTMFSVGGWENSQFFSSVTANEDLVQNFLKSLLCILDDYHLDGLDIDWKYPVKLGRQPGLATDKMNYIAFLAKVREALDAHQQRKGRKIRFLLTISAPAFPLLLASSYNLAKIIFLVDWINVITLDYFGPWADPKLGQQTGPIAPLYFGAPIGYSGKHNVDYTFKYYFCRLGHNNMEKLVMGIGFYGRFWNHSGTVMSSSNAMDPLWRKADLNSDGQVDGGILPWSVIYNDYLPDENFGKRFHQKTKTPFLTSMDEQFLLVYEDRKSIMEKVEYTFVKGLGGVSLWAVDFDDQYGTLIRTASSSALCGNGGTRQSANDFHCPLINEKRWWTQDDGSNALKCGKSAPLINGFYARCDPYDPGYGCCSADGFCGSGKEFCECSLCVNYYENPQRIWDPPIKP